VNPLAVGQLVARNLVPVAGILFFGWNALNVLTLYLVDTVLMMAVILAGLMRCFIPVDEESWASRANSEAGYPGVALVACALISIPLAVPLIFMTGGDLAGLKATFSDPTFRTGVAVQFATAFWSWLELRRAVDAGRTPTELRLKRRFALVFLRWLAVLLVVYSPLGALFAFVGPFAYVIVYAGVSAFADIAPDRFLRLMPGGAEDADPLPGEPPRPDRLAQAMERFRRNRKG
jgi:hypothetical protein